MNKTTFSILGLMLCLCGSVSANKIPGAKSESASFDYQKAAAKIDDFISKAYPDFKVEPNPEISDETFVRRVYLQIAGRIPTPSEFKMFMAEDGETRRADLISDLIQSEGYVSNHFNFWADILRINDSQNGSSRTAIAAYKLWVKAALRQNMPYDQFVRELVSAKGYIWENGAIGYYQRDRGMPLDNMSNTVRIFLGTRLECAQCHNHPFDKWTQMDYFKMAAFSYGMTANRYGNSNRKLVATMMKDERQSMFEEAVGVKGFPAITSEAKLKKLMDSRKFSRVGSKYGMNKQEFAETAKKGIAAISGLETNSEDIRNAVGELYDPIQYIASFESEKSVKLPHDYQYSDAEPESSVLPATMFGGEVLSPSNGSLADSYAEWMTSSENPTFTKVVANRLWKKVFGAALIEPVDELTDLSKPSHPELMTYLEELMKELDYDMQAYLKVLYNTSTFQRESYREELVAGVPYHFSGPVLRRMSAEQVWDSLVALMIDNPDHYMPNLEKDLANLEEQKQIFESLEGKAPEEFLAMARAAAKVTRSSLDEQTDLRAKVLEARNAEEFQKSKEIASKLGKIRNETRRELAALAYTEVKEGKDIEVVMNNFGVNDGFMDEVITDLPKQERRRPDRSEMKTSMTKEERRTLREETKKRLEKRKVKGKGRKGDVSLGRDVVRASEMETPARRGHFLREFGQSDREIIENSNDAASVPQALALMNGPIMEMMLGSNSVFAREIDTKESSAEKVEAAFTALFSRRPTDQEKEWLSSEVNKGDPQEGIENVVWALLNTSRFLFVE